MKHRIFLIIFCIVLSGCERNSSEAWEDVKTAGRYVKKSVQALFGYDVDESRQLASNDDFSGPDESDFIPLEDSDIKKNAYALDYPLEQPEDLPIPTKKAKKASKGTKTIFNLLHFETDSHVITAKEDLITIDRVAAFLKKKPQAKLIIEGHCDQRASADYNIALGMRRAQHVRVLLAKKGVKPHQLYTVSYGKEKPVSKGKSSDELRKNRRAEFKLLLEE